MVNRNNQIQLCYMDSKTGKTVKPLTAQLFNALTQCDWVSQLMTRIEQEPDEEKKNELKGQLPVIFYACQMPEDKVRPTLTTARPSGLCLHDFDHMTQDVRQFYQQNIAGHEEEMGIQLAHITPRGKGLRLVTVMNNGERIVQCQKRMAANLGLTQYADAAVKDITRLSFIPGNNNMLYLNDGMFSLPVPEDDSLNQGLISQADSTTALEPSRTNLEASTTEVGTLMAENMEFEGVKYSQIIQELLNRLATNGTPTTGERNNDLYAVTREIRHCTNYNFDITRMLLTPYFKELSDQEIRRTIHSAIESTGKVMTPAMKGVLDQLRNEQTDIPNTHESPIQKLPKLPPVIEKLLKMYKPNIRPQVFLAMLPILGTYSTHLRFRYWDNMVHSTSFLGAVVGTSSQGKAFTRHLYNVLAAPFIEWDNAERKKAREYQKKINRRKEGEDFPDDPMAKIRLLSDDITTSLIYEYLENLNNEHALQFTEEVDRLTKARRSRFSDNDDLYCKAFDNAVGGKESKSALTKNVQTQIFLNTLFVGTYEKMHGFLNNPEGGLNNRFLFALLPLTMSTREHPHYEDPSPELRKELNDMLTDLWVAGTLEDEEKMEIEDYTTVRHGKKELDVSFLSKAMDKWCYKCDDENDENPDTAWRTLANRAAVNGFRAGVLMWQIWKRSTDPKILKYVKDIAIWIAETARYNTYSFNADDYERIYNSTKYLPKERNTKNKKLFSLLNDEFTVSDLINLRMQNGDSTQVKMIICRWMGNGLIRKTGDKTFVKIKKIA